jgi:hypothetical protein
MKEHIDKVMRERANLLRALANDEAPSAEASSETAGQVSSFALATCSVQMTSEKWGWSLARAERITLEYRGVRNAYYGIKILGVKLLLWCRAFDS